MKQFLNFYIVLNKYWSQENLISNKMSDCENTLTDLFWISLIFFRFILSDQLHIT